MAFENEATSPPPVVARLDAAVTELEELLDRFGGLYQATAEELAQTKAELAELQDLHATVCRRLDETIARLKTVLNEQAQAELDLSDG